MSKTVDQRLTDLGKLFKQRNALYGDNYKLFGKIMVLMFQNKPVTLTTEADFNRFALYVQIVGKVTRYANQFAKGGHEDSLDDNSVYSQMLQEIDQLIKKEKQG